MEKEKLEFVMEEVLEELIPNRYQDDYINRSGC